METTIFQLPNPTTGQLHKVAGVSPVLSRACQLLRPSGFLTYHMSVSEALALAKVNDTVMLLRDCNEPTLVLRDGVNINAAGFSLFSTQDAPMLIDNGQAVFCQVTNVGTLGNTYGDGLSEWNALVLLTGNGSLVTVQGRVMQTYANGGTLKGKAAIVQGPNSSLTLRFKHLATGCVEVAANGARILVEDGSFTSIGTASRTYRIDTGLGYVTFRNMNLRVKSVASYDSKAQVVFDRCRIVSEQGGIYGQSESKYTFIDCQLLAQIAGSAAGVTGGILRLDAAGQSVELIGTNTLVAKGGATSWIEYLSAGTLRVQGKVLSNKPSPGSNFTPLVGTAANGSILTDAATDLTFLP